MDLISDEQADEMPDFIGTLLGETNEDQDELDVVDETTEEGREKIAVLNYMAEYYKLRGFVHIQYKGSIVPYSPEVLAGCGREYDSATFALVNLMQLTEAYLESLEATMTRCFIEEAVARGNSGLFEDCDYTTFIGAGLDKYCGAVVDSEEFDTWYLYKRALYERINRALYEGVFFLTLDNEAPSEDFFTDSVPGEHTPGVLFYFSNPFIKVEWPGFGAEVAAAIYSANNPRRGSYIYYHGLPDELDACTNFFRGRSFRRLLEVDNPLILPYGTNIRLSITSDDVIHSWAVPSFGIKIDAIPGRINQTALVVLYPGVFMGQCSELCGVLHSFMPINIEAIHPDVFFEEYNFTLNSRRLDEDEDDAA